MRISAETCCRPATMADAAVFAPRLRALDQREVLAYCRTVAGGVALSVAAASARRGGVCMAGFHRSRPVMLYGVTLIDDSILGGRVGRIWGLSTRDLEETPGARMATAKVSKLFVEEMRGRFDRLENEVLADYRDSVRWLEWLGFCVDRGAPVQRNGETFWPFWWER